MNTFKLLAPPQIAGLLPARCATGTSLHSYTGFEKLPAEHQYGLNAAIDSLISTAIDYLVSTGDARSLHSASRSFARSIESLVRPSAQSTYYHATPRTTFRSKADMDQELIDLMRSFSAPHSDDITIETSYE